MGPCPQSLPCLEPREDGSALLYLHVQPRAAANALAGLQGDGLLKLRLTTPPVDGKANKAVIDFLAKLFRLPKSAFRIHQGHQSRKKIIHITGGDTRRLQEVLLEQLADPR
ncbi:MAG: DUF167 domain-containing protein [Desulfobulbus sp.]